MYLYIYIYIFKYEYSYSVCLEKNIHIKIESEKKIKPYFVLYELDTGGVYIDALYIDIKCFDRQLFTRIS